MSKIPKLLHQLWIGTKPAPTTLMDTWKVKHPDFEYIQWSEAEFESRGLVFECQAQIDAIEEINGKADILRWELLYKYGGVFVDADSICIEPLDEFILAAPCFAGYENEQVRNTLIATGTMGFPPGHPLVRAAIDWILANPVSEKETGQRAWYNVGPGLITRLYKTGLYKDLKIYPSHFFLPIHYTGLQYKGHEKVYAYQEWGSTKKNYETMNSLQLPVEFTTPQHNVSVLVSSYNTKAEYVQECLTSIQNQTGSFAIEVVWINDGSDRLHTAILERLLDRFKTRTRFITVVYSKNEENRGIGYTLNKGIQLCSNEIIVKMDSDDIMLPDRIQKQMTYMLENPHIHLCGGQIQMMRDGDKDTKIMNQTSHPSLTWNEYKKSKSHWFINHPTVCYRRSSVLAVGNYNPELKQMAEDFELELRMLKKYKQIHNMKDVLLKYRLHDKQVTHKGGEQGPDYWKQVRNDIIQRLVGIAGT